MDESTIGDFGNEVIEIAREMGIGEEIISAADAFLERAQSLDDLQVNLMCILLLFKSLDPKTRNSFLREKLEGLN